jgi:hypothetical protein
LTRVTLQCCKGTDVFLTKWGAAAKGKSLPLRHLSTSVTSLGCLEAILCSCHTLESLHLTVEAHARTRQPFPALDLLLDQMSASSQSLCSFSISHDRSERVGFTLEQEHLARICGSFPNLQQLGYDIEPYFIEQEYWRNNRDGFSLQLVCYSVTLIRAHSIGTHVLLLTA